MKLEEKCTVDQPLGYIKIGNEHKVYRLKKLLIDWNKPHVLGILHLGLLFERMFPETNVLTTYTLKKI